MIFKSTTRPRAPNEVRAPKAVTLLTSAEAESEPEPTSGSKFSKKILT